MSGKKHFNKALQKERTDKLIQALWSIANDLPDSAIRLQGIAKNALQHDKIVYSDNRTKDKL